MDECHCWILLVGNSCLSRFFAAQAQPGPCTLLYDITSLRILIGCVYSSPMWPRKPSAYQIGRSSTGTLEGVLDNSARPLPRAQPQPVFPVSLTWPTGLPVIDKSCPRPHQSIWPATCTPTAQSQLGPAPKRELVATHEERQYKSKTDEREKGKLLRTSTDGERVTCG
ncbi:hypothetical protein F4775DRAFT_310952 [Biscogniauxia sp. FL1348]|nr:hypothetical protein F4775DRAFT_310952 [Biscogniauxia sp. FL1348]